ncbi:MAG: beta-lactamase family protein, partial [bacterium]|nr:beta-lactamase family protein [bacterium]
QKLLKWLSDHRETVWTAPFRDVMEHVLAEKKRLGWPAIPSSPGLDRAMLGVGLEMLRTAVEEDEIRGAVMLVARDGKIVLHEAVGWRDKEQGLAIEKDSLFHMASNTKPVVAAAIMMLAEEGKLALDDPVRKYLTSYDNYRSGGITIRHLLTHTGGLRIRGIFLEPL